MNPCWFILPASLDVIGSFLNFTGLLVISASSYQILKMLSLVFVVLFSILVFRRNHDLQQWFAILSVIVGLAIVAVVSILFNKSDGTTSAGFGIACMIFG